MLTTAALSPRQFVEPRLKHIPVDAEKLRRLEAQLAASLLLLETAFLPPDAAFLCGASAPSIADLLALCELMQVWAVGYDWRTTRPRLARWADAVADRLRPHFDDVNAVLYRVHDAFVAQAKM